MSFGQFKSNSAGKPMSAMSDINVTPMVDVMLVLLVIFIIAAPLMTHAVRLDLPSAVSDAVPQEAITINISFDDQGALFWDSQKLALDELENRLAFSAKQKPQPEILLRADKNTRYELIAQVMAAAQSKGLSKIGFVTDSKTDSKSASTNKNGSTSKAASSTPLAEKN